MSKFYVQRLSDPFHWFYRFTLLILACWLSTTAFAANSENRFSNEGQCLLDVSIHSITSDCEGTSKVCLKITGGLAPYIINLELLNLSAELTLGVEVCFENLPPGTHVFKVRDLLGCTGTVTCTIPETQHFDGWVTPVTCHGSMDGAIDLEVPIDVAPIYYKWSGPNGFSADTEDIKGLKAGVYHVKVFGRDGVCYGSGKWEVPEPRPIKIDLSITQPLCGSANICAFISGGTGPYRTWGFQPLPAGVDNSNFTSRINFNNLDPATAQPYDPTTNQQRPFCAENLPSGTYYIIVKDAKGCFGWKIFRVNNVANFQLRLDVQNITCGYAESGKICFKIEGGTGPFKTKLSMPYGNQQYTMEGQSGCFENLRAGEYILTTTDGTGCTVTERVKITEPTPIEAEFFLTDNDCRNGASGCLKVSGGMQPYTIYAWRHPNPDANVGFEIDFWDNGVPYIVGAERAPECEFPNNHDSNGLYCARNIPPGHYILLIVDKNHCYTVEVIHIPRTGGLRAEFEITSSACDENVSGCLKVYDGTRPYKIFVWRHRNPDATDQADPHLGFDNNGDPQMDGPDWESTDQMPFDPEDLNPTLTPVYKRCARNIPPGYYIIVVIDKNGCHALLHVRIPRPNPVKAKFEITSRSCEGVSGCLYVEGGMRPYNVYVWRWNSPLTVIPTVQFTPNGRPTLNGGPGDEINWEWDGSPESSPYRRCVRNIPPGYYYVLVVDKNHCYDLIPVHIPETPGLWLDTRVKDVSCNGEKDGKITLKIQGGESPYTIYFNESTTEGELIDNLTVVFDSLMAGVYTIKVVDANGCEAKVRVEIKEPDPLMAEFILDGSNSCNGASGGCLRVKGGTRPYRFEVWDWETPSNTLPDVEIDVETGVVSIEGAVQTDLTLHPPTPNDNSWCFRNIPPGDYLILVKDANGCYTLVHVHIPPYEGLTVSADVTDPACNSEYGGQVKVNISGGTAPYTIYFDGSVTTTSETMVVFENVGPGNYWIKVVDKLQCIAEVNVTVRTPGIRPNIEYATYGDSACVHPEGGTAPYKIEWLNMEEGEIISTDSCVYDLDPGIYMVTISDNAGCSIQKILIIDPQPCEGGIAKVRPESIISGETVKFVLEYHIGDSIQWQFRTEFTDWIDIPGATTDVYTTPMVLTGSSKVVFVRAKVFCADGSVVYSTEASFKIRGDHRLTPIDARIEDANLFNPAFRIAEARTLGIPMANYTTVYPTVSREDVQIRFDLPSTSAVRITVLNELGMPMHQTQLDAVNAGKTTSVSVRNWQPGMYFIRIEGEAILETKRIVVK
ncbi:MAG: T9SS type A sorting domain-containing protein [Saprospiraceae bacterium]|nr:T9SS type A sorting domain-containing protein [Saprospiraceae bacterium]